MGAKNQVPFWPVQMTLQQLGLMPVIGMGGTHLPLNTVTGYLALGFAGLPVFAGALAGPAYYAGPSAGYMLGFLMAAPAGDALVDRSAGSHPLTHVVALLLTDALVFASGVLWLGLVFTSASEQHPGLAAVFASGVPPFLLGDPLKLALATALLARLRAGFPRARNLHRRVTCGEFGGCQGHAILAADLQHEFDGRILDRTGCLQGSGEKNAQFQFTASCISRWKVAAPSPILSVTPFGNSRQSPGGGLFPFWFKEV